MHCRMCSHILQLAQHSKMSPHTATCLLGAEITLVEKLCFKAWSPEAGELSDLQGCLKDSKGQASVFQGHRQSLKMGL